MTATTVQPRTTSYAGTRPLSRTAVVLCAVGGAAQATGAVLSALLPDAVSHDQVSAPLTVGAFRTTEGIWAVTELLMLLGTLALVRSGLAGRTRASRIGGVLATVGMALMVPAQLGFTLVAGADNGDGSAVAATAFIIGASTLAAVGFLVLGVTTLRARVWSGGGRWTPLLCGVVPLVVTPALGALGDAGFFAGIAARAGAFVLLGLALSSRE